MKWFKHQSDARNSLKLRKVRRKYGAAGYAIYWFCLEAIAYEVDKDNLTFDLKEDAETIAFELSIQEKLVEEIMLYMVKAGLFESAHGTITCLKLAESMDKSMTNSPKMRAWLGNKSVMTCADGVMTLAGDANTCAELEVEVEVEVEKKRSRKEDNQDTSVPATPKREKFSEGDMAFVDGMLNLLLQNNPNFKQPNKNAWASDVRKMREIDNIDHDEMARVFTWASKDSFWSSNILSPSKLRKQWNTLQAKSNQQTNSGGMGQRDTNNVNIIGGDY